MKLGEKKKPPFSASLISQVLPTSWIAKFKQMGIHSGQNCPEKKQKGKWNSVPANTSSDAGKFYGGDGDCDAFWRLSFGEAEDLKNGSRPVFRYNSDGDGEFLPSSCQNYTPNTAARVNGKFNMVAHGNKSIIFTEVSPCVREKVAEIRTPRLRVERVLEEKQIEFDGRKDCCISPLNSRDRYLRKTGEYTFENGSNFSSEECFLSEWKKSKERNEQHRKSLYISRPKQKRKVRVYSPRTSEICKIKAFEDMKKAKLNMKKKAKEKTLEDFKGLESLAVEKCSYDPQKDFRDSMIEMIEERRISEPQELEQLLACYLTLNSDQYHDLIIKVFRQVWLELSIKPSLL